MDTEKPAGAYTFAEAARILWATRPADGGGGGRADLRRGEKRLRYWVDTGVVHDGLAESAGPEKFIHFPALVSLRIVCLLWDRGVGLADLRRGERRLRADLGVPWPFAAEPFWRHQGPAFPKFAALIAASVRGRDGAEFLEGWLAENAGGLQFDDYGLACAWRPAKNVLMHGGVAGGHPCVAGRRVPVWVIHSLFAQGESVAEIAGAYGLTERQVGDAVAWGKRVAGVSA